jgi:predicted enzyme involved in methoxymalonyl-ACP biosynthesis
MAAAPLRAYLGGARGALARGRTRANELGEALADLRRRFRATLVVGTLPWPDLPEADALDLDGLAEQFVSAVAAAFDGTLASAAGILRLEIASLQRVFGARFAFDAGTWYLFRQPYTEGFFGEIGVLSARLLAAARRVGGKCLVLDADNTLWGGVLGEDGIGGIRLGDEFPGSAYLDLQRLALHLRRQGIFLAGPPRTIRRM